MEFGASVEEDADIIRRYAEELKRLGRPGDPEDLAKRLKEEIDSKREDRYYFPVSSSFGPSKMRWKRATRSTPSFVEAGSVPMVVTAPI